MRRIAEVQGVTLVDLYNLMLPDANRYIGVDGLHPNEAGYARMADLFFQAIQGASRSSLRVQADQLTRSAAMNDHSFSRHPCEPPHPPSA